MGIIPAYGFFIHYVNGIRMNNVEVSYLGKEIRPALILKDVKNADLFRVKLQVVPNVRSVVLDNVESFSTRESAGVSSSAAERKRAVFMPQIIANGEGRRKRDHTRNGDVQRRVARDSGPAQPALHAAKRSPETQIFPHTHRQRVCVSSGLFAA